MTAITSRCVLNVVVETQPGDLRDWLALGAAIADMRREGWGLVEGEERPDGTFLFRLQRSWELVARKSASQEMLEAIRAQVGIGPPETDEGEAT